MTRTSSYRLAQTAQLALTDIRQKAFELYMKQTFLHIMLVPHNVVWILNYSNGSQRLHYYYRTPDARRYKIMLLYKHKSVTQIYNRWHTLIMTTKAV